MGITSSLFNKYFNIYRVQKRLSSGMGEVGTEFIVLVQRNVQGRLGTHYINEPMITGALKDAGAGIGYRAKLFVAVGTDIKVGDRVIQAGVTTERYYVDYINTRPGGLTDHHLECLLTTSSFQVAS